MGQPSYQPSLMPRDCGGGPPAKRTVWADVVWKFQPSNREDACKENLQLLHSMAAQAAAEPLGLAAMLQAEAEQRHAAAKGGLSTAKREQLQNSSAGTAGTSQDVAKQKKCKPEGT